MFPVSRRILRQAGIGLIRRVRRSRPPDFVVGTPATPYLERWWLIPRNRVFNVYLHHFIRSDDDRALHDHPWPFLSVMLYGQYEEFTSDRHGGLRSRVYRAGHARARWATHTHRIATIDDRSCWTLFVTGPRIRQWGFHCPQGWVHWRIFTDPATDGASVGRGCGEV